MFFDSRWVFLNLPECGREKKNASKKCITSGSEHLTLDRYQRADELENLVSFTNMNYSLRSNFKLFTISHFCSCGKPNRMNSAFVCFLCDLNANSNHSCEFFFFDASIYDILRCDYVHKTKTCKSLTTTIACFILFAYFFFIWTHIFRIRFRKYFSFNFFSFRIIFALEIGIFVLFFLFFYFCLFYSIRIFFFRLIPLDAKNQLPLDWTCKLLKNLITELARAAGEHLNSEIKTMIDSCKLPMKCP